MLAIFRQVSNNPDVEAQNVSQSRCRSSECESSKNGQETDFGEMTTAGTIRQKREMAKGDTDATQIWVQGLK